MSLLMQIQSATAQIPVNDPAWIKDTTLSDDFGGTTLKTYKWWASDSVWDQHSLAMDFNRPNHNNVNISGGTLKLHADTLDPNRICLKNGVPTTFHYQAAQIGSIDSSFKYGYLEISAKYPVGHKLYWHGFWLVAGDCINNPIWYNEIDIAENGPDQSYNGHEMGTNFWWSNPNSCNSSDNSSGYTVTGLPRVDSIFHKYALQWDVDNVNFYFDDSLVRSVPNSIVPTPQHSLNLVLDFFITPWVPDTSLHMPAADYEIDYFNYYKLRQCN